VSAGIPEDPTEGLIEGILQAGDGPTTSGDNSELLTFLFADIRGYTRFTQERGDEAAAKLTGKFAAIVRDLVADFDGTVFELRGDEAMCIFTSPRQSLRLAVALQQRFVAETIADDELPLAVGIGIDAGEAVRGEDGYRGGALNLAARLCSQAKAGDVLASGEVTHLARRIDGVRYVVLDGVTLKGLSEPVRPVRVVPEGDDPAQQIAALLASASSPSPSAPPATWLPGPLGRLSSRALVALAVVLVLVVAAVAVGVASRGGGTSLASMTENSVGIVDPGNGHIVGNVAVGRDPVAAASGYGATWTADTGTNTVSRIDTSSHQVGNIGVGSAPSAVAVGMGSVWVTNSSDGTLSRIAPATNTVQTITVGTDPGGVAVGAGSVWVSNTGDGTVSRVDPALNMVVHTYQVGDSPTGITAGKDIWVADSGSNSVTEITGHGTSFSVAPAIPVGNDPEGIAVVGNNVWVANNLDGTVSRIPVGGTSALSFAVGTEPTQIAAINGQVWVTTQGPRAVVEVNPATGQVMRQVPVGVVPSGVASAGSQLWVTGTINPLLHRGGTLQIVGPDPRPVDPSYADPEALSLINDVYDGLVGYRHAAGAVGIAVVPDLATTIPVPTNGDRTYAFQLRSGIRWSNGDPVTVADVKRGIERTVASGFSPLQEEIVGAAGCRPSHCVIPGVKVDAQTRSVTITLVHPNADFLDDLANGVAAVPAATPMGIQKPGGIPATGPYEISRYVPGKLIVLTRNRFFRQWSAAAQPDGFPDRIEWQIDKTITPAQAVNAVAAGRSDWADARGAGSYGSLQARFGDRLFEAPMLATHGVVLNTKVLPFKSPLARRALAYAINRNAVQANWFTNATVSCQVLPLDVPGHRPFCPYTLQPDATGNWTAPNSPKADRLVARSHTKGMKVQLWTTGTQRPAMTQVLSALTDLGYKASLHVVSGPNINAYWNHVNNSRTHTQAAFYGWVGSDFNPAGFFVSQFQCSGITLNSPFNENPSLFCSPSIDRLISHALHLESTSSAAADATWAQVDRRIVQAAPFIPLVNASWVDVVSNRVHNYQRNLSIGVLFGQMWVR
jgi:ABC-type transport system substrate-binding protein/class 3 adenylate cyclase